MTATITGTCDWCEAELAVRDEDAFDHGWVAAQLQASGWTTGCASSTSAASTVPPDGGEAQ